MRHRSAFWFLSLLPILLVGDARAAGPAQKPRLDRYGDALPERAIARMGSSRLRVVDKKASSSDDGPRSELDCVTFSPDGGTLFSIDSRMIREWKPATGEPGRKYRRPVISATAPVFSADRKMLARPSITCLDLWEIREDKPLRSLEYKGKDVMRAVTFSPDGKYLLSAHNHSSPQSGEGENEGEGSLHFWDVSTGKETRSYVTAEDGLYSHLVITPDGGKAIAGSVYGSVTRNRSSTRTQTSEEGAGHLFQWDLRTGRELRLLKGHRGATRSLSLSGNGKLLASASADHTIRLWELDSGETLYCLPIDSCFERTAVLSPDGRLLASYMTEDGNASRPAAVLSPGSGLLASDSPSAGSATIRLWSTATGKPVLDLRGHNSDVRCLAFSPDNQRLASGLRDGTALVWDVSDACRVVRPQPRRMEAKELDTLWVSLADANATNAHRAACSLIAGGDDVVAMLKRRLKPVAKVEPKRLQKLLADLDAEHYAVREAAARELQDLGERAEAALMAARKNKPSLEVCRRLDELLTRVQRRELSAESLQALRAVMVLEQIGNEAARAALTSLTTGAADTTLTREAKESLRRLTPKPAAMP